MENELKEIASRMNEFSKKYECKLEVETYESQYINTKETRIIYKITAIKPEKIIAQAWKEKQMKILSIDPRKHRKCILCNRHWHI